MCKLTHMADICEMCKTRPTVAGRKVCFECQGAPHGELATYSAGCRCDLCKAANTAYQSDYRQGVRKTRKRWAKLVGHGTSGCYQRGCRCDECLFGEATRQQMSRHQMSTDIYDAILRLQGGGCAICQGPQNNAAKRFDIDHKHSCEHLSGRSCSLCWRGLLCRECNKQLERTVGHAYIRETEGVATEDDERVLAYIRNPPAQQVLAMGVEPIVRPSESQN